MKGIFAITLAAGFAVAAISPAHAEDGCGRGFHRGPHGHCHPDGGPALIGGPAVGVFYAGHGYWDGNRYWHHRERWHDGWRYR